MKKLGYLLILIGLILTLFTTFTVFTKEKVIEIGNAEIVRNKPHKLDWSPFIGIVVMGVGAVVLWRSNKKQ